MVNLQNQNLNKLAFLVTTAISISLLSNQVIAYEEASSAIDESPKANVEAEGLYYDGETKSLIAEGNVEVTYDGRYMKASQIEYNRKTRQISAQEGIEFRANDGITFKAESIITNDQLDSGEMSNVKAVMKDGSTFESKKISIIGEEKFSLRDSVYSPCKPCENGGYLWNVNAKKIYYDSDSERVYYRDATVEILDIPVLYTPYISHPTPFAKSKSGFLTPAFGSSSEYGTFFEQPYYYNPKPNLDFTFSPRFTTEDGLILTNEFRHLLPYGNYEILFSGAYPDEVDQNGDRLIGAGKNFRGHIDGFGDFDIGNKWQVGFEGKRVSDDTYLQRYNLGYEDVLTSQAYIRRIDGRDYVTAKALSFQGLRRNDDPDISPYVLPLINFNKSYLVDKSFDQRLNLSGNILSLRRELGQKSTRFSTKAEWEASHVSQGGHKFDLTASTRFDYYKVDEVLTSTGNYSGGVSRVIPELTATWSYPLMNDFDSYSVLVEPIIMAIVSDKSNKDERITNEDSQNIEIYDYNLFQPSHISGYDIVEEGSRVNYGLRTVVSTEKLGDINILFGQNYRLEKDSTNLSLDSGLADYFSDYVGRVTINNGEHFSANYRFRVDKDNFKFRRNELGFDLDYKPVEFSMNYTFIDGLLGNVDRQEVYADARYDVDEAWTILAEGRKNLDNDANSGTVFVSGGAEYSNDCMTTAVEIRREYTRDRDVEPSTQILFKVSLQNLGS